MEGAPRLARQVWVADSEVSCCFACRAAFSSYRRKHHCRQCGRIFCRRCSNMALPLPQYGYKLPVRVCQECVGIAHLVSCALSNSDNMMAHAAGGLAEITAKGEDLERLLAFGGVEALVWLCEHPHQEIEYCASGAIYNLGRRGEQAQQVLVEKGAVPALVRLAKRNVQQSVLMHVASTLYLIATNDRTNHALGDERTLATLCRLAGSQDHRIAVLAARALAATASNASNHASIIHDKMGALRSLMSLLLADSQDVRRSAAKAMAYLSLSNDSCKGRVIQADTMQHGALAAMMKSTKDPPALAHAACAVANLAAVEDSGSQTLIHPDSISALCTAIDPPTAQHTNDLLRHVARGLANFALHKYNRGRVTETALPHTLPDLLDSSVEDVRVHAMRAVENLVSFNATPVLAAQISSSGILSQVEAAARHPGPIQLPALRVLRRMQLSNVCELSDTALALLDEYQPELADVMPAPTLAPTSPVNESQRPTPQPPPTPPPMESAHGVASGHGLKPPRPVSLWTNGSDDSEISDDEDGTKDLVGGLEKLRQECEARIDAYRSIGHAEDSVEVMSLREKLQRLQGDIDTLKPLLGQAELEV